MSSGLPPVRPVELFFVDAPLADIDPAFGHWLAGFIDGEGCFSFSCSMYKGERRDRPRFALFLREDDAAIVEEIHTAVGCGVVRWKAAQRRLSYSWGRPQMGWIVDSREGLRRLIAVLDQFPLRSKKASDYAIWREAVMLWINSEQRYREGRRGRETHKCWAQITAIRERLMEARAYKAPT